MKSETNNVNVDVSYLSTNVKNTNGDIKVGASKVLDDWDSSKITWNNQPKIEDKIYAEEKNFKDEGYATYILTELTKEIACGRNEQIVGDEQSIITNTLYNNDSIKTQTENNGKSVKTSLYSKLFDKTILESEEIEVSNKKTTFNLNIYGNSKAFEYIYDAVGNIYIIKTQGVVAAMKMIKKISHYFK